MHDKPCPRAVVAAEAPLRTRASSYPEPFAARMAGRDKRPLGDLIGLGAVDMHSGDRVESKRFRDKAREAAKGGPLGNDPHLPTAAVAEPFGLNPEGSRILARIAALRLLAWTTQAASPRLALHAKRSRARPPNACQQTLTNFGVNLTRLAPGAVSALRHAHSTQDEFVFVLEGCPVLVTDAGETPLAPGMCAGFRAGTGDAHQLANRSGEDVLYLEVGDRDAGDTVSYPDDDLRADMIEGRWRFSHRDGTPY